MQVVKEYTPGIGAALVPIIDVVDMDVAYAMSAPLPFNMVMILLFSILGRWLGYSDMAYGQCTGTVVNDTASVATARMVTLEYAMGSV